MIGELRQAIAAPAVARRLAELGRNSPASTLLSLDVDLDPGASDWLALLPANGSYWYWARPDQNEWCLGLGATVYYDTAGAERFTALEHAFTGLRNHWRREGEALACFGFAFDPEAGNWLPNARLVLPALVLRCREGRRQAILSCVAGHAEGAVAHWLSLLATTPRAAPAADLHRPAQELADQAWLARVHAALRTIAAGGLDKVVLARSIRLQAATPIAVAPVLAGLVRRQADCTIFAIGDGDRSFIGATPERLVSLHDGIAEADALAGTAWLATAGLSPPARLDNDKNAREQGFVVDGVRDALARLCTGVEAAPTPEVLHLRQVSHLRTRLRGTPKAGVSLFDLAAALHPTPAVGGSPGPEALAWLRDHEEQRAGWYSGGIGWLDATGNGEVAVALRCAEIAGQEALLSAGAGIVAGSDSRQELAETEAKLQVMQEALRHPAPQPGLPIDARTGTR